MRIIELKKLAEASYNAANKLKETMKKSETKEFNKEKEIELIKQIGTLKRQLEKVNTFFQISVSDFSTLIQRSLNKNNSNLYISFVKINENHTVIDLYEGYDYSPTYTYAAKIFDNHGKEVTSLFNVIYNNDDIPEFDNERKINLLNCGIIKSYNTAESYTSKRIPKVVEKAIWKALEENSKQKSTTKDSGIEIA